MSEPTTRDTWVSRMIFNVAITIATVLAVAFFLFISDFSRNLDILLGIDPGWHLR